jgi:tRNA(Ile)-lysidine synthase TilS/MesJ
MNNKVRHVLGISGGKDSAALAMYMKTRHPELFRKAQEYEKDGYSWMDNETLDQIIQPVRMAQIKLDYIATLQKKLNGKNKSNKLVDILADENEVCANCFI